MNEDIKEKNLKLLFIKNQIEKEIFSIEESPIMYLISNYKEIEYLLDLNTSKILKYLYFSKKKIHNILYDEEELINIKYDETKNNFSYNFYLNLLINDNLTIANYSYPIDFIEKLNENKFKSNEKYKLIFNSKFIIDLIDNYKQLDEYDEESEEEILNKIKEENYEYIKNNINIFKDLNLNINEKELNAEKSDKILSEIINSLIINNKFENIEYSYNIIKQLELENIDITKTIFDQLFKILDKENEYIKKYKITKKEDLLEEKNINFYYILLKYILKNSIYIYKIPFLLKTRKFILKIIKTDELSYDNLSDNNKEKLEYILQFMADSKYYFDNKNNKIIIQLKEILIYYKEFYPEKRREDINIIEDIINNKKKGYEKYLKEYDKAKEMNIKLPIIKPFIEMKRSEDNKNKKIEEIIHSWELLEKMIKNSKIKKIIKEDKQFLINYIKDNEKKKIILKVFTQEQLDNFINTLASLEKEKKEKNKSKKIKNEKKEEIKKKNDNKEAKFAQKENEQNFDSAPTDNIDKNHYNKKGEQNLKELDDKKLNIQEISTTSFSTTYKTNKTSISTGLSDNNIIGAAPLIQHNNMRDDILSKILKKCIIVLTYNKKESLLKYNKIYFSENNIEIAYDEFIKYKGNNNKNESSQNFQKLLDFLTEIENKIKNNFKYNYNLKFQLELKENKKDYKNIDKSDNDDKNDNNIEKDFDESDIYDIDCEYIFFNPINNQPIRYREENILINGTNSNEVGFFFFLNDINNPQFENIENKENINNNLDNKQIQNNIKENDILNKKNNNNNKIIEKEEKNNENVRSGYESTMSATNFFNVQNLEKADPDKIIEFIRIIGKHNNSADYIIELSKNYYISGGSDNYLILYDSDYLEKTKIKDFNDWVYKVGEKKSSGKDDFKLFCVVNKTFDIVSLDKNLKPTFSQYQLQNKTIMNFIEMKENNFILSGIGGTSYYLDLFSQKKMSEYKITDKYYIGGIRITDKTAAITSNCILPDGEDNLLIYHTKKKQSFSINNYSFIASVNGLALMPVEEIKSNYKILLCACKQYKKGQKNGILLVNPQLGDNKEIEEPFYLMNDFEVYCFCPILIVENKKGLKKEEQITNTDYFFVGGMDLLKRKGKIKLFKMLYGAKAWETKIKYIQDIEFESTENFEDFDGPISCITQSKETGHILITCYNGYVYLFTPPNIDYYLEEDREE